MNINQKGFEDCEIQCLAEVKKIQEKFRQEVEAGGLPAGALYIESLQK